MRQDDWLLGEWYALDHTEGEHPPGLWVAAGRDQDAVGVFIGIEEEILGFIEEAHIDDVIGYLRALGEQPLRQMLADVRPDVVALRAGRERIAVDFSWRRIP
jgi:hypothetical protein